MTRRATLLVVTVLLGFSAFCDNLSRVKWDCVVCGGEFHFAEPGLPFLVKSEKIFDDIRTGAIPVTQVYRSLSVLWVHVCSECRKIPVRCELCGLPVKEIGFRTSDGRTICAREAGVIVVNEDEAQEIFRSAREAAVDTVGSFFTLKYPAVNVHLSDVLDVNSTDTMHTAAISKSTPFGSNLVHDVSVHTGFPKKRAFYACVHEYAHQWIRENIGKHQIEPNTLEGLCELVAYKVAEGRNDAAAQKEIPANKFTQGRVNQLIQYAAGEDLSAMLAWVKNGTTETLTEGLATATEASLKPVEIPLDIQVSRAQLARPRPQNETLTINGTIKGRKGTLVLLNGGVILGKGESGVVKINGQSLKVRCIDIQSDTATFRNENSADVIVLKVRH